ncbi:fungal-specific transcription factor domain-containing protein [Russula earlei]|uniref:Fungal-specific transcription factor domain-containing protein n=1 Tax=Russula earlei TaxID=71964 RepID=A0ACC0UCU7_9AGAM|nr:fungal-specific transcription factor domain-containing protein [Russula earlei]
MRESSVSTDSPESSSHVTESTSVTAARPKLKRNRIILCQQCHKRKQQCDRGHPCSRCVNRGCPDACTYEEPKEVKQRKLTASESGSRRDKVSFSSVPGQERSNGPNSENHNPDLNALAGLDALLQVLQDASTSNAVPTSSHDSFEFSRASPRVGESPIQAAATALNQLSQAEVPDTHDTHASMMLSFRGFGTPTPLSELHLHFPNQKITAFLLSFYFNKSSSHWLCPVIHRPSFENWYRTFSSGELPPTLEFVALLAITCATALQFLPETEDDATLFAEYTPGRQVLEQRLVDFSRSVLFTCTGSPISSFERIQALTLFAMYQWNEGNAGETWYIMTLAIRMAQTLSLNRDGVSTWRMRPEHAEIRRRLWWMLFKIDRFLCMEYRRPYMISEQHIDAALPMNLDQADVVDAPELTGKPLEEPTEYLYHLYQCQLHKLSGHMWDQCFSITLPTYRAVIDLEEKLRKFELELPASLRYQTSQMAIARPYLSFQFHSLTLEIVYHRMQLLRPFLFIHPTKEKDFEGMSVQDKKLAKFHRHARSICVTFCKRQLASLQLLQNSSKSGHMTWSGMTLLAFKSALTIAIAIIMDAQNPENEELEEWIAMAQGILMALRPHNALAQKALDHLHVIRKRTLFVVGIVIGRCATSDPVIHRTTGLATALPLPQCMDRTTWTLSQPQPCLNDLLGREEASDPFWSTLRSGVFAGHFPGIESLLGPVCPQTLEQFLDSCLSMQSRLPHMFTV